MRLRPDAARWMGAPRHHLRVSDAERNEVADKLSRHFADGRLDQAEFKERLDAAMSAKTQGDLAGLFDDLPPLASEPPPPPSRRRRLVPFLVLIAFIALLANDALRSPFGLCGMCRGCSSPSSPSSSGTGRDGTDTITTTKQQQLTGLRPAGPAR